jgi:hypothetical protein
MRVKERVELIEREMNKDLWMRLKERSDLKSIKNELISVVESTGKV